MDQAIGGTPADPNSQINQQGQINSPWANFDRRLAAYLATMLDDGDHLVVEAPGDPAGGDAPYVQFAAFGGGQMIRAEAAGNVLELPVSEAPDLAALAVQALIAVYGVPDPGLLSVRAWGPAAAGVSTLGLTDAEEVPADVVDLDDFSDIDPPTLHVVYAHGRDELAEAVADALREKYGETPATDEDGDFVLTHLGQPAWVRARADQPAVEIMARVVHGVYSRRSTAVEIGLLNRDHCWVKWDLRDRSVWQTLLIPGYPFAMSHLTSMLDVFMTTMDETRNDLALRAGGRVA